MKKLFLTLILTFAFIVPAFADGPVLPDAIKDSMLELLADSGDELHISTDGTVANSLGSVALTEGVAGADYDLGDGASDGRSLTVTTQDIVADGNGTADTWILYDSVGAVVLAYGPITSKVIATGQTYNFPATVIATIRDATIP
jgi:hypothetical protein